MCLAYVNLVHTVSTAQDTRREIRKPSLPVILLQRKDLSVNIKHFTVSVAFEATH